MAKNKHTRKARSVKPSPMVVNFFHVAVTHEQFSLLTIEDRYCVLLLGHIQHEISWLQRTALIVSRSGGNKTEIERSGTVMQGTFLVRLLLGKLNELRVVMETAVIRNFLSDWYDPEDRQVSNERIDSLFSLFESNPWIQKARNKHFLHYPTLGDVRETLVSDDMRWNFDVYFSETTMNTLYSTSDVFANLAWYKLVDKENPFTGLDHAFDNMVELSGRARDVLERVVGNFIDRNLRNISDNKHIAVNVETTIEKARLPMFIGISDKP